jgi:hypothetical protein
MVKIAKAPEVAASAGLLGDWGESYGSRGYIYPHALLTAFEALEGVQAQEITGDAGLALLSPALEAEAIKNTDGAQLITPAGQAEFLEDEYGAT